MSIFTQLRLAVKGYGNALSFLKKHSLWAWLWVPALVNLILMTALTVLAWQYSKDLTDATIDFFGVNSETTADVLFWTVLIASRLVILLLFVMTYRYFNLILLSPVLALMAEKLYVIQTGDEQPFDWKVFLNNVMRGVIIAIKNLAKELTLTLIISLLTFTVVLAPLVPVLIYIVQSYFYGFSMMDYQSELKGLSVRESGKRVWRQKGLATGNGAIYNLMLIVPVIGPLTAPIISLVAMFISVEQEN